MYCMNLGILKQFIIRSVPLGDAKLIGNFIQLGFVSLAHRHQISMGVSLIDGNKLRAKPQSHNSNIYFHNCLIDKLS